ncbi:MAG TPA: MFS transporter [Anaeromyxobacter sp.]
MNERADGEPDQAAPERAGGPGGAASSRPPTRSTSRPLTVVALLLGLFLAAMEMTVVSTAMPTVVAELGGLPLYAWAFAGYMLAATVTVPIWGKLADLRGRKPVLLAGLGLFLLGSSACGWAGSMGALIAWRAVQGLGAGALQPITFTIVGDLFDVHERGRMQGLFGAVWGLAGLVGPLVGGAIVHTIGWRWIFWVNLPFGIASGVVLAFAYHERPERHEHRLDVGGAALLALAVIAALAAVRSGGAALVGVPIALLATAAFLAVERRAKEPLLPLDLFAMRVMSVSSAAGALMGAAMMSTVTFVPLWVQSVLGAPPTAAGAAIAPMAVGWPIASAISGRLIARLGYRRLLLGGFALSAGSALALAFALHPGTPLRAVQAVTALFGAGLGLANPPLLIAIQTSVPWNRRGVATASTIFFRTIGGTLAVGLLGGALSHALAGTGARPELVEKLLGPERSALDPAAVASVAAALQGAMGIVFWAGAAIAVAAFVVVLGFPHVEIAARRAPGSEEAKSAE